MNAGKDFAAMETHFRVLCLFEFTPRPAPSPPDSGIDAMDAALTQARMEGELVWESPLLPAPDTALPAGQPLVPDDYRTEFLPHVTQLLFGRSGPRGGRYYRLSHPLKNTIFRNGLWLWPDAGSVNGVDANRLASTPCKLLPDAAAELFLLGSGVGVLSISLALDIDAGRPVPIGDVKQLNYHLCQQRHRACPVLAIPHVGLTPEKLADLPPKARQEIQPLPALTAPLEQRLGRPGGVFSLVELKDFLLGHLRAAADVRETHPQFALYTAVTFPHTVRLDDPATRAALAPALSGMAQLEEHDHAGSPEGEVTVPHALMNTRHWTAVGPQAVAHFLADQQSRVGGQPAEFDAQRARVVRDRYFIPWLMAALPRLQFQWAVREAAHDAAVLPADGLAGACGARLQTLQSALLEFDALAYGCEVSVRASHNRFHELCQQALRVDALYADATRAAHGLASLCQQRGQQAVLREHGATLEQIRLAGRERAELNKQLVNVAATLETHVDGIRKIQRKLEYVEIFLVSVYAVYLVHYLGEAFHFPHAYVGAMIVGGSTLAALLAIVLLQPHHGDAAGARKLRNVVLLILGLIGCYLAVGFGLRAWQKAVSGVQAEPSALTNPAKLP